jgi:hypothetical protein
MELRREYSRKDRYWQVFYPTYDMFKSQYDGCVNRLINILTGSQPTRPQNGISFPEEVPLREPDEETKKRVKQRDGKRCLCCGCTSPLQVDHIIPWYLGGTNDEDNLQTLCKYCNQDKGILRIDFRKQKSPLKDAPAGMTDGWIPSEDNIRDTTQWEFFLRSAFNIFYRCVAVDTVEIGQRSDKFHQWRVTLHPGNNPNWLKPYLAKFIERVRRTREEAGLMPAPREIIVSCS